MGRPLYKDINGVDVRGAYAGSNAGIRVAAYFNDSLHDDCFIIKQKGGRRYVVQDTSSGETGSCKLVQYSLTGNGQMIMFGYLASSVPAGQLDPDGSPITLHKLQKRTAQDWDGNRYTWVLENDSSIDYISLTPIVNYTP